MKKTTILKKAMYGTSMKPSMMKSGGNTKMKKMGSGGMHMMPDGSMMKDSMMKKGGSSTSKTPKMAVGGSLKNVPSDKVGLSKLPTAVRNKMGFKKTGGTTKKK